MATSAAQQSLLPPPTARPGRPDQPAAELRSGVDWTRLLVTAQWVVGAVLVANRLAARPSAAVAHVAMGPGGWVSMKGGAMSVRPAGRAWTSRRIGAPSEAGRGGSPRRPWWAHLLNARALQALLHATEPGAGGGRPRR
jgi:hypothetical protein